MRLRLRRPTPPTNARIVRHDGSVVPLELVYRGIEDGVHLWASTIEPVVGILDRLEIGVLPPNTAIVVASTPGNPA